MTTGKTLDLRARLLAIAFAVALPVLLIAGSVRVISTTPALYDYGWWRYDVSGRTGLPDDQLDRVSQQFRDYFTNSAELLDLTVVAGGRTEALLSEREILHMRDVKALMRGVFLAEWIAGAVVIGCVLFGFAWLRSRFWRTLRAGVRYSAYGTLAGVVLIAVAAIVDFDGAFTLFHQISFRNDLWQLNPYQDYLLLLFPEAFFFDATMAIALMTALEFAAVWLGVSWFERKFGARHQEPGPASSRAVMPLGGGP